MKKAEIEVDQLIIWILAVLLLITLLFVVFKYKENIVELLTNFGNILRFGGGR